MPLRNQIKLNAKVILRENWFKASALVVIIYVLELGVSALENYCYGALGIKFDEASASGVTQLNSKFMQAYVHTIVAAVPVSAAFSVLTFLLVTPLIVGMIQWYWQLTENKPQGIGDIFSWFGSARQYGKSLWLMFSLFIRLLPWLLALLFAPACLMLYGISIFSEQSTLRLAVSAMVVGFGELWFIGGCFVMLLFLSRYFLAPFLFSEDSARKVGECIRESVRITKKCRGEIYRFLLSFIGWLLLMLVFMDSALYFLAVLPALYVVPYFLASCAVYAKYLIYSDRAKENPPARQETIEFKA